MSDIIAAVSDGRTLNSLYKAGELPVDKVTVYSWLHDDADAAQRYARARSDAMDVQRDECDQIVEDVVEGRLDVGKARVALGYKQWLMERMAPRVFGSKVQIGGDADGVPVRTQDVTQRSEAELIRQADDLRRRRLAMEGGGNE